MQIRTPVSVSRDFPISVGAGFTFMVSVVGWERKGDKNETEKAEKTNSTDGESGEEPQLRTVPHLLAGGVAGAISKTCTAPLACLTILFQVRIDPMKASSALRTAQMIMTNLGNHQSWHNIPLVCVTRQRIR
jgi:hypothetical protein